MSKRSDKLRKSVIIGRGIEKKKHENRREKEKKIEVINQF